MSRKKRATRRKRNPKKDAPKRLQYPESAMESALNAVQKGMSVRKAATEFKVPRITLLNKVNGKYPKSRKMGPECILTDLDEQRIVDWLTKMSRAGFPISKTVLLSCICTYLKEKKLNNPFKNNVPGKSWYASFLRRHPSLTIRTPQNLTSTRGAVTKTQIVAWSNEVQEYLTENGFMEILNDPRRVFNCDEAAFFLCPKGEPVIVPRSDKSIYRLVNSDEKECITVLMTGNAAGTVAPPLVLFSYERLPKDLVESVPKPWGLGKSTSGWMTHETFYEHVANVFYPWLIKENIALPVILFVDGHSSHLSLAISKFCQEKGVIIVCFFPNATHLLQPMDVAVFRPLKKAFKEKVTAWRLENNGAEFKKVNFCKVLQTAINTSVTVKVLSNDFRKCGLVPWDISKVDFTKIPCTLKINDAHDATDNTSEIENENNTGGGNDFFTSFESSITPETLAKFKCHEKNVDWKSQISIKDHSLFEMWKNLKPELQNESVQIVSVDLPVIDASNVQNHTVLHSMPALASSNIPPLPQDLECELEINLHDFDNPLFSDVLEGLTTSLSVEQVNKEPFSTGLGTPPTSNRMNCSFSPSPILSTLQSTPPSIPLSEFNNSKEQDNQNVCQKNLADSPEKSDNTSPLKKRPKPTSSPIENQENSLPNNPSTRRELFSVNDETPKRSEETASPLKDSSNSENQLSNSLSVTPSKQNLENVASPFKKVFFFPEKKEKERKRKPKEKVPAVVTGEKWQEYELKKQEKKRLEEEQKQERKKLREEKAEARRKEKAEKEKNKRQPKAKSTRLKAITSSEESDVDAPSSDSSEEEDYVRKKEDGVVKINENSHVIVYYEGEYFPGLVVKKKENGAEVKVMTMSGPDWRWPERDDQIFYSTEEIIQNIEPPALKNSRGLYSVPEINLLRKSNAS